MNYMVYNMEIPVIPIDIKKDNILKLSLYLIENKMYKKYNS